MTELDAEAALDELEAGDRIRVKMGEYRVTHREEWPGDHPANVHLSVNGSHYLLVWLSGDSIHAKDGDEVRLLHHNRNDERTFITRVETVTVLE